MKVKISAFIRARDIKVVVNWQALILNAKGRTIVELLNGRVREGTRYSVQLETLYGNIAQRLSHCRVRSTVALVSFVN